MPGTFEHFQVLQIVKTAMNTSEYANLDQVSKAKCDSVLENIPAAFQQLLNETTSNCRLFNRQFYYDLLFCANPNKTSLGYRDIYSVTKPDGDAETFWNLKR
jgi:hypothetical protein